MINVSRNLTVRAKKNLKRRLFIDYKNLLDYGTESRNRTDTPEGNGF